MGWLALVLSLLQALPQIIAAIIAVESAIGGGNGALKKQLVLAPIAATPNVKPEFVAAADKMVDHVVTTLNAAGTLPKAAVAA